MAIYSIGDLEKLSGIKAHTIRIWEQRYAILKPMRTDTNIRCYCEDDLKLIFNIAMLNRNGFKISKIACLTKAEIAKKVEALTSEPTEFHAQIDALTLSMIEMAESKFESVMSKNITEIGFERTIIEIVYPFLEKLGVLWLTGSISPCQENFITNLIRQKLIAAIDKLSIPSTSEAKKFLLYLPKGENQELSLLLMQYLIKSRNHSVIYLGNNISGDDIQKACRIVKPDFVFTMLSEFFKQGSTKQYVNEILQKICHAKLLLTGYQAVHLMGENDNRLKVMTSLDETVDFLKNLH